MIAITISTNYADILEHTLKSNQKLFEHWFIVTDQNDIKTIKLLENQPNITTLFWDFQNNGRQFDKGGAVKLAQSLAYQQFPNSWYLIIDSDICLPKNFKIDESTLDPNYLYGSYYRRDYYKLEDYQQEKNYYQHKSESVALGFFQLYKQKYFYQPSNGADKCDEIFHRLFFRKQIMLQEFICHHLGKSGTHWNGRKNTLDFIV